MIIFLFNFISRQQRYSVISNTWFQKWIIISKSIWVKYAWKCHLALWKNVTISLQFGSVLCALNEINGYLGDPSMHWFKIIATDESRNTYEMWRGILILEIILVLWNKLVSTWGHTRAKKSWRIQVTPDQFEQYFSGS